MLKIALSAAFLAAALPASAFAQERLPDVHVHYGDLDLTDPAAVRILDRRLASAVAAACPSDAGLRQLDRLRVIADCRKAKQASVASRREAALAAAARNTLASAR